MKTLISEMKRENTLLAFEEDVKQRSLTDWFKAHTSGFKPLHRYEGTFKLNRDRLVFEGKDVKDQGRLKLDVPLKNVTDVYYGFDNVFKGREERAWPWNKPLRIKFRQDGKEKTVCLFVNFHHRYGIRSSDNEEIYRRLLESLRDI
ncbi:hypothetical protein CW709_01605 [Candidatus Bathyarchaeota archaeon]|nr:MAG: hypothetical protein CW709_01605 [Candidatus Bathyarchaeota archaeon]